MPNLTIALVGNPNSGKSTVFNALTGMRQHTGNWPGKTVMAKTGACRCDGVDINFVDLPGTYSLAAYSPDEVVARDYIITEQPDAVICVVDATNLERNLYLVVQLLEMGVPVIVALNMTDQAEAQGIEIDNRHLSSLLGGVPVLSTTASRRKGIDQLLTTAVSMVGACPVSCGISGGYRKGCNCNNTQNISFTVDYGEELEEAICSVSASIEAGRLPMNGYSPRWLSLKLLEGEKDIAVRVRSAQGGPAVVQVAENEVDDLTALYKEDVEMIAADHRYSRVSDIYREVTIQPAIKKVTLTDRIDRIATNRIIGLPIFLVIMYLIFRLVIDVSAPYLDWVDGVVNGPIAHGISAVLIQIGAADWLQSLFIDGVIAGVGGVLTFVPGLIILFLFLALLEDSGYLARAAFVMDRFMQVIGLHGKSVIPLMLGFGCAVPAIYATRTMANRRDRLLTALLVPFMSCSARLPVYLVFALAFFGTRAGSVIWLMYLLGVFIAIVMGFIFSRTILRKDENTAFVLELPPYRLPTSKGLLLHTWENTWEFIRRAGTLLLAMSVGLWFLLNLPWGVESRQESLYGRLSTTIAPVLEPAGFGNWESSGALITGLVAKEMVVSTLAQVYLGESMDDDIALIEEGESSSNILDQLWMIVAGFGEATAEAARTLVSLIPGINLIDTEDAVEDTTLSRALQEHYSPLAGFAFLIFVLLYVPCVATMGAIKQEFGSRWAWSAAIYQTLIALLASILVFQGGKILGLG
ncbi:MAG: ferrous iron transport protein B [Candidatus Promineifilaceae bacterium]